MFAIVPIGFNELLFYHLLIMLIRLNWLGLLILLLACWLSLVSFWLSVFCDFSFWDSNQDSRTPWLVGFLHCYASAKVF